MFDLSDLPPLSDPVDGTTTTRTFADIIEDVGDLPDPKTTSELEWAINEVLFSGEDDARFEDAWITTRPVKEAEIEETVRRDDRKMHRLTCEITRTAFYVPAGAVVPVVVFASSDDDEVAEPWSERIHPRLVAAGPEMVMKALISSYLRNKIFDAGAELMWALQQLNLLREKGTLDAGWPDFGSSDHPSGYELDEDGVGPGRFAPHNDEAGAAR